MRLASTLGVALLTLLAALPPSRGAAAAAPPQQRAAVLTGMVTDGQTGQPVVAVQVYIVGTSFGALTDETGRYRITGMSGGVVAVEARRIGYAETRRENVRIPAEGTVEVNFTMRETALALDAIVATGVVEATSARRVPFTVARLAAADLPVLPENPLNAIQGKLAGATVVNSPQPGAGVNILLRTPTSIYKSSGPLFVVDGVVLSSTFGRSSADLSSLDIESIEVVKGAAASSLYGSRAANGVIQIRTKRGAGLADGQTRVAMRGEVGTNRLRKEIGVNQSHFYLTNAAGQYVDGNGAVVERADRVLRPVNERFADVPYAVPTYDHIDAIFDPGVFTVAALSLSQARQGTNFLISGSNQNNEGIVLTHGGYNRNDVRVNLDHRLLDELSTAVSVYHSRSDRANLPGDVFEDLVQQAPDISLLTPDPDGTPFMFDADPTGPAPNPLYELYKLDDDEERARTLANVDARWAPINWLTVDGSLSYDRSDRTQRTFFPRGFKTEVQTWTNGYVQRGSGTTSALNAAVSANAIFSFDDLTTRFTARSLMEKEEYEFFEAEASNLTVDGVPDLTAGSVPVIGHSTQDIRSNAYFVSTDLDYAGRYVLNGLVRRDGSSLFGPDERWHTYYRASGAWRMAEESWWPSAAVDEFKVRYSIGTAGGRPSFGDQYETFNIGTGGVLSKSTLGNRFLKPERATEQEMGVDAVLWGRHSLQLTYATQKTEDQLILIPLPAAFGFSAQWQNAGTVEGNTWEATLQSQLLERGDTRITAGLIFDRSRHEITEFDRACFRAGTDNLSYRCAGEPLGVMYGHTFMHGVEDLPAGLPGDEFQVNDEGLLVWVGPNGSFRDMQWGEETELGGRTYDWGVPIIVNDESGNPAVVRIGDSNADFHVGMNSNVRWKTLSLYGLVDIQRGGDVYNRTNQRMYQYYRSSDTDQAGRPDELKKPIQYYTSLYAANLINDRFVEDGSYVKLREMSLQWAVPVQGIDVLRRTGIAGLTVGVIGRNLLTFTDYKGYDPEVGSALLRMDDFVYPQYRTFTGTLEIQF